MAITAAQVKELRERTGSGMMECKKALVDAGGDMETAIETLRKTGLAKADKKAGRVAAEGLVVIETSDDHKTAAIVEVNCETDFVAKNESFVTLANELAELAMNYDSKEAFLGADFNGLSVQEKLLEQTGVIGEKIEIGGFDHLSAPFVGSYIHAGNKIATLVGLSEAVDNAATVAKDIAMQAAAMNPVALNEAGVDQETIDKEIEIAKDQLRQEGKPEAMLDKIAAGKLKRFFKDNTLVNQDFIKDSKMSVSEYVKSAAPNLEVTSFVRVALG